MQSVEALDAHFALPDCSKAEEGGAYTVEACVWAFIFLLSAPVTTGWLRASGTGIGLIDRLDADGVVGRNDYGVHVFRWRRRKCAI